MKKNIFLIIIFLSFTFSAAAQNAADIIKKMEDRTEYRSAKSRGKMVIHDRFGTRTTSFLTFADGTDNTLIEFTSKEERGQKILRTKNELYLYYPDAEQLIRLQGPSLRDSVLGSDVSYEDMTGGKNILDSYTARLLGSELLSGAMCYKIALTAKRRNVPYYKQVLYVDQHEFYSRKTDLFARSGDLLKEMSVEGVIRSQGKIIPSKLHIEDKLKGDSWTEFIIDSIEINVDLDPALFSLEELTW